jgi:class II lanthipeptide synthase
MVAQQNERDDGTLLQTAALIGQRLVKSAIWDGDRCNWVGPVPDKDKSLHASGDFDYGAIGPELYAGTSGVALFLAALHRVTGARAARSAAIGGITQALSATSSFSSGPLGLFDGLAGVALSAALVGDFLKEHDLAGRASSLLKRALTSERTSSTADLKSGVAGIAAAALAACRILNDASLADLALELGRHLVMNAERFRGGYSWPTRGLAMHRNPTGLAHGAAGIGHVLLELYRAIGDPALRNAAESAFAYERLWYDESARNWLDFRRYPYETKRSRIERRFAIGWCSGAPGIGLVRLRAWSYSRRPSTWPREGPL